MPLTNGAPHGSRVLSGPGTGRLPARCVRRHASVSFVVYGDVCVTLSGDAERNTERQKRHQSRVWVQRAFLHFHRVTNICDFTSQLVVAQVSGPNCALLDYLLKFGLESNSIIAFGPQPCGKGPLAPSPADKALWPPALRISPWPYSRLQSRTCLIPSLW